LRYGQRDLCRPDLAERACPPARPADPASAVRQPCSFAKAILYARILAPDSYILRQSLVPVIARSAWRGPPKTWML